MAIKSITLARPDPAIVGEMAPFLKQLGIAVEQVTDLMQLRYKVTAETDAVVISLAVTSTIPASVERVLGEIMQLNPRVALIFSSVLPLKKKRKNLNYVLSNYFSNPEVVDVEQCDAEMTNRQFLYICGNDLANEARRIKLGELILKW